MLGDTSGEKPTVQMWKSESFDIEDQRSIFDPLPLVSFLLAYKRIQIKSVILALQ